MHIFDSMLITPSDGWILKLIILKIPSLRSIWHWFIIVHSLQWKQFPSGGNYFPLVASAPVHAGDPICCCKLQSLVFCFMSHYKFTVRDMNFFDLYINLVYNLIWKFFQEFNIMFCFFLFYSFLIFYIILFYILCIRIPKCHKLPRTWSRLLTICVSHEGESADTSHPYSPWLSRLAGAISTRILPNPI